MNVIGSFAKKIENILFSENFMIGQSSFKCPGLSVHSVISASRKRRLTFLWLQACVLLAHVRRPITAR